MNNAEKFIEIYNQIDKVLSKSGNGKYETFSAKIKNSTNRIIIRFKEKLIDYGNLRNAIAHNPKIGGKPIAFPLDEVVSDFEEILIIIKNPPKVYPKFHCDIVGAKKDDKLDGVLKEMREKSLSQIPVFDNGKVIEVVNTNTISRWLGRNMDNESIVQENPTIGELFEDIEFEKNYKFIAKNCDIYSAHNHFIEQLEKHNRNLDALFITQTGKENETILGIITVADITKLTKPK